MAVQALLFSKNPKTVESLTSILAEAGMRVEVSADIFSAMEKGTKQPFPCIIVDWSDQPESSYLVKRARESAFNQNTVPIAIVDGEFGVKNARENQVDFVFHRPFAPDEARAVLAEARRKMIIPLGAANVDLRAALKASPATQPFPHEQQAGDPNLLSFADRLPSTSRQRYEAPPEPEERVVEEEILAEEEEFAVESSQVARREVWPTTRKFLAAVLLVVAGFAAWQRHSSILYLAHTPEGGFHVLRESLAALFYENRSGAQPVGSAGSEAQQDAYFSRTAGNAAAQPARVQVVNGEVTIPEIPHPLHRAIDFPLPTPEFTLAVVPPPQRVYAKVPESLRNSQPIGPPVVGTVNPATQFVPVVAPLAAIPQVSEPVDLAEQNARALAIRTVDAIYPQEAMSQKLHGPVVLQTLIGRDGSVQDIKIVRGYFLLGRAAAAAVKQWRFKPYLFNGQPVSVRTQITLNFSYPPA
jgi:TonB family protein